MVSRCCQMCMAPRSRSVAKPVTACCWELSVGRTGGLSATIYCLLTNNLVTNYLVTYFLATASWLLGHRHSIIPPVSLITTSTCVAELHAAGTVAARAAAHSTYLLCSVTTIRRMELHLETAAVESTKHQPQLTFSRLLSTLLNQLR